MARFSPWPRSPPPLLHIAEIDSARRRASARRIFWERSRDYRSRGERSALDGPDKCEIINIGYLFVDYVVCLDSGCVTIHRVVSQPEHQCFIALSAICGCRLSSLGVCFSQRQVSKSAKRDPFKRRTHLVANRRSLGPLCISFCSCRSRRHHNCLRSRCYSRCENAAIARRDSRHIEFICFVSLTERDTT